MMIWSFLMVDTDLHSNASSTHVHSILPCLANAAVKTLDRESSASEIQAITKFLLVQVQRFECGVAKKGSPSCHSNVLLPLQTTLLQLCEDNWVHRFTRVSVGSLGTERPAMEIKTYQEAIDCQVEVLLIEIIKWFGTSSETVTSVYPDKCGFKR